ncbi:MAG: PEP-CTERM sorting domain-containing protein [Pirellulales bacterium]|nr:PEP-CTERM sorting domain-containing protein [Pirellulales bacterium]
MTRTTFHLILGSAACTICLASATTVSAATILVGGSTLNGNFNADTSATDSRTFVQTPNWVNLGSGGTGEEATRTNLDVDGSRNAVLAEDATRIFGIDTGYAIAEGDVFDISYVWRDAFNWIDGSDQVQVSLFVTTDDTIGGARTNLVQAVSGTSTIDSTYESVDQDAVYTALIADAGKQLFVEIDGLNGAGGADGFARLDNFVLEVTSVVPEPSTLVMCMFALAGLLIRRRRR